MGRGIGTVQQESLNYLGTLGGWAGRAGEVAMHIFGLDWQPPFTSAAYQTTARALRTLAERGLVEKTSAGLYRIPQPSEMQYEWHVFEPDPKLAEIRRRRKEIEERMGLVLLARTHYLSG